jgi:ribose/xylose/arabinose/galactoside ABC-type transport system permease subunit
VQRFLVTLGLVILLVGLAWPWIARLGLGRLPGDIRIERDGFGFYFPLTTSIVISLLVTLVLWWFRR